MEKKESIFKGLIFPERVQKATEIQTLIFDKTKFKTAADAKKWARDHSFSTAKGVDETGSSFRIRQKSPGDFVAGSFRTIDITDGIKAVIGTPKGK